jgi:hypothetical protein
MADFTLFCYDGYALGYKTDERNIPIPNFIKVTYPSLAEVLADDEKANHVLTYRGLNDLPKSDITYGDIMIAYAKVVDMSPFPIK